MADVLGSHSNPVRCTLSPPIYVERLKLRSDNEKTRGSRIQIRVFWTPVPQPCHHRVWPPGAVPSLLFEKAVLMLCPRAQIPVTVSRIQRGMWAQLAPKKDSQWLPGNRYESLQGSLPFHPLAALSVSCQGNKPENPWQEGYRACRLFH